MPAGNNELAELPSATEQPSAVLGEIRDARSCCSRPDSTALPSTRLSCRLQGWLRCAVLCTTCTTRAAASCGLAWLCEVFPCSPLPAWRPMGCLRRYDGLRGLHPALALRRLLHSSPIPAGRRFASSYRWRFVMSGRRRMGFGSGPRQMCSVPRRACLFSPGKWLARL